MKFRTLILAGAILFSSGSFAQNKLTKEQILSMSTEELSDLPLEDLMQAVETLGVSSVDELFAMIMNKNVASASKKEEDSFKSPLASTVITKAEIRSYGISTIEEALRLIPGMIVQEKSNGMYDVHIRGLNNIPDNQMMLYTENSNTLLMIDGRIAHNYATGNVNFDILPISIEDVDRIEVVRGANAALYGPNAVNGVINIITEKTNAASKTVQGSFHMGTQENYVGDIAYRSVVNDKFSFGVTANLQYRRRNTNELYVYPTHGIYYSQLSHAEWAAAQQGLPVTQLGAYIAQGKLIDASNGGYYKTTDIQKLKQAFSFGAIANYVPESLKQNIYAIQQAKAAADPAGFKAMYGADQASEATVALFLKGLANNMDYQLYDVLESQGDIVDMFDDPGMSRKSYGFNSYFSFRPNDKIYADLSLGYQQSRVNTTPIGELPFSMSERISKTGYVNLDAHIYDLSLSASYSGGTQDYQNGIPGFKCFVNNLQLDADYNFEFGDLTVNPGFTFKKYFLTDYVPEYDYADPNNFEWSYHEHGYKQKIGGLRGYLNNTRVNLDNIAPSLRLDYTTGGFRAIAAVRADKTNIPDEWNISYQGGLSYSINENNFVRASYGTAMRSANVVNSSTDYVWHRDGLMPPDTINFQADPEAPLAKIKNFEFGYRWRPSKSVLVDAEAFYSTSEEYGALKAHQSSVVMPTDKLYAFMTNFETLSGLRSITDGELNLDVLTTFMQNTSVVSTVKYAELPYKVKQMGFGVNVDWIISPKLIAKFNVNAQKTEIDNYYAYDQNAEILGQLGQIFGMITSVPQMASDIQTGAINELMASGTFTEEQLMAVLTNPDFASADFQTYFNKYKTYLGYAMSDIDQNRVSQIAAEYAATADKEAFLNNLMNSANPSDNTQYAAYYALRYGVYNNDGIFSFGNSKPYEAQTVNGHKHKATPSVYGMVGLIFKPTPKVDITAYGNYIGKRTYETKYSTEDLDDRFTVSMKLGYKPVDGLEVFFTGHNMLNNEKQEFPYGDKIGGVYSVGVNFGF